MNKPPDKLFYGRFLSIIQQDRNGAVFMKLLKQ